MTKSIKKIITALTFLMIPDLIAGQGIAEEKETKIHMPSFSELAEGWNTLNPGGETICTQRTEFEFCNRAGDPSTSTFGKAPKVCAQDDMIHSKSGKSRQRAAISCTLTALSLIECALSS